MVMKTVYLDYAAATPLDPVVQKAMLPFYSENFYNPSALYLGAREVKQALEGARGTVARTIGAKPSEIIFTSGGSESANLAIRGVMENYPNAELLISSVEHDAVRGPASKFRAIEISVDTKGRLKLDDLKKKITDKTVLISVMYANNEVGTVQPISEVVAFVASVRSDRQKRRVKLPLFVHTDACQAPLYLDVSATRLGVDLMTLNGGKIYGPKQTGILYHRSSVPLTPQILGGGQELGYRSGTENVAGCVGFATALERAVESRKDGVDKVRAVSDYFLGRLINECGAQLNGDPSRRLANNIHVTFDGTDNERVLFSLDLQGVYAAAGSACSASSNEPSHVLLAMGKTVEEARSSLRFSIGKFTTKKDIDFTIVALQKALKA